MDINEIRRQRVAAVASMRAISDGAAGRDLNDEERTRYDELRSQVATADAQIQRAEELEQLGANTRSQPGTVPGAPVIISAENRGDNRIVAEQRAVRQYVRGDEGAIREMDGQMRSEARASNNTDMNITTPADGGYLVPTGHYAGIIARANEIMLAPQLGCMPVPGLGTTVNVPTGGAVNPFVATNEVGTFDIDGAAFGQAPMTLAKFTKDMILSDELQQDEGSQLLNYLNSYVGDAYALTHNAALVTETLAGGTSVTLAAAAAATATDIPLLIGSIKDEYATRAQWIGKRATQFKYLALTGNNWQFVNTPQGTVDGFWGYPFNAASNMAAVAAGAKSLAFGAWQFMGYRTTGMTMLRDPFAKASTGQLVMHYYTRIVYKTLQQEAIVFGTHPTA